MIKVMPLCFWSESGREMKIIHQGWKGVLGRKKDTIDKMP